MIEPTKTRGFLNCNPGNMDRADPPWLGEIRDMALCTNDVQRIELGHGRFCVFSDAQHGIRAMVKNLRAYRDRLGCKSVREFINRWAPPNENNTEAYIHNVAGPLGVSPDAAVDIEQRAVMRGLVSAIICVECAGMPYAPEIIEQGLTLAGVGA
jgi:hypothetical protein